MNLLSWLPVGWRGSSWENDANFSTAGAMVVRWSYLGMALRRPALWHRSVYSWTRTLTWAGFDLAAELAQNLCQCIQRACLEREKAKCFFFGMLAVDEMRSCQDCQCTFWKKGHRPSWQFRKTWMCKSVASDKHSSSGTCQPERIRREISVDSV